MMRVVLFVAVALSVVECGLVVISSHLRRDLLATHNFYRRQVRAANMRRLEWDETLENAATKRASSCSAVKSENDHPYGENVYVTDHIGHYRGLVAIALQTWANDGYNYTAKAYGTGHSAPRYTQMMWAETRKVGCSISKCQDRFDDRLDDGLADTRMVHDSSILVCLYDPKGNIPMQYPYELSGRKCSNCPPTTHCEKGLCVEGMMSDAPLFPTFVDNKPKHNYNLQPFSGTCNPGERWVCECKATIAEFRSASGQLTQIEKNLIVETHNSYRDGNNLAHIVWDTSLEVWAKYVIRCTPLYPGPSDCYTNFGKGTAGAPVTNVVHDWAGDKQIVKEIEPWCRTPQDSAVCNRNTNLMQDRVARIGCEAMSCGNKRQLTCIYRTQ